MRTTIITIAVAGLLATGAGTAAARPGEPIARADAAAHAKAVRAVAAYDASLGRATASSRPAPATVVRVTRTPLVDGGFDWADAGIGAGVVAALLLGAAGVALVQRSPRTAAR